VLAAADLERLRGRSAMEKEGDAPFAQRGWTIEPAYLDALAAAFGAGLRQKMALEVAPRVGRVVRSRPARAGLAGAVLGGFALVALVASESGRPAVETLPFGDAPQGPLPGAFPGVGPVPTRDAARSPSPTATAPAPAPSSGPSATATPGPRSSLVPTSPPSATQPPVPAPTPTPRPSPPVPVPTGVPHPTPTVSQPPHPTPAIP